jgi:acetyl-CoA synthetase
MSDKKLSGEVFYPSEDVLRHAHVRNWEELSAAAGNNLEEFWAKEANELHWFEHWDRVLDDSKKPFFQWFVGGKTNIVYNCLDRHITTARKNKLALLWEGENGNFRSFSYFALRRETCKFANVLRALGVQKGDRVTIYMGRVPELAIALLSMEVSQLKHLQNELRTASRRF